MKTMNKKDRHGAVEVFAWLKLLIIISLDQNFKILCKYFFFLENDK